MEVAVKQEIDTLITGTEIRFYFHREGMELFLTPAPPPDNKVTRVLNNCHSLQCGGGGHFPVFVWRGHPLFS